MLFFRHVYGQATKLLRPVLVGTGPERQEITKFRIIEVFRVTRFIKKQNQSATLIPA